MSTPKGRPGKGQGQQRRITPAGKGGMAAGAARGQGGKQPGRPAAAGKGGKPAGGGKGGGKKLSLASKIGIWIAAIVATFALVGFAVGFAYYRSVDIPSADEINKEVTFQTSTVYFSDGETEVGRLTEDDRVIVDSADIPDHVKKMFVAAEDQTFYENRGISPVGILRAGVGNIKKKITGSAGNVQGGSTITQQYVKLLYLTSERTYERKLKEAVLALKIDQELSKDEILTAYLNTIFLGRRSNGIEVAANNFFGKSAKELSVSEAAMLAGITPAPEKFSPDSKTPEKAKQRWAYTLDNAVELGFISKAEREGMTFPEVITPKKDQAFAGTNGYLLDAAKKELAKKAGFGEDKPSVSTGGYKIVLTVDAKMQQDMIDAINDTDAFDPSKLKQYTYTSNGTKKTSGAPEDVKRPGIAIDPSTGGIKAMYGGPDYLGDTNDAQVNLATEGAFQAGSTFKVFTTIAALKEGYSLRSKVDASEPYKPPHTDKEIENSGSRDYGTQTLQSAVQNSINTAFVRTNVQLMQDRESDKYDALIKVAHDAGLPNHQDCDKDAEGRPQCDPQRIDPEAATNTLGSSSVSAVDLATAWATIAAGGDRRDTHIVKEVFDSSGEPVFTANPNKTNKFEAGIMADTTYAMQKVVTGGTASKAQPRYIGGHVAAGKTGTSSDYKSSVFAGFTPQLVAVFAAYSESRQENDNGTYYMKATGLPKYKGRPFYSTHTVPVWSSFMKRALEGSEKQSFPKPVFGGKAKNIGKISKPKPKPSDTESETSSSSSSSTSPSESDTSTPTTSTTTKPEPTATPTKTPTKTPTDPTPTKTTTKPKDPTPTKTTTKPKDPTPTTPVEPTTDPVKPDGNGQGQGNGQGNGGGQGGGNGQGGPGRQDTEVSPPKEEDAAA